MTKSGISIIILTLNGAKHLERLLETFFETNTHAPVELIIIDHGSTDKTSEVVSLYATRAFIRLINRGRNHSFASSCNLGASKASHPYLLFLNNDIIYTSDVLPPAMARLADPTIGAVGVRLDDDPNFLPPGKEPGVQHTGIAFEWDSEKEFYRPVQIRHKSVKEYTAHLVENGKQTLFSAVIGTFLLCRKSDFNAVGGFCEEYDYGFEDIDFCLQLGNKLNKACCCINDISLLHGEVAARKIDSAEVKNKQGKNIVLFKKRVGELINNLHAGTSQTKPNIKVHIDQFDNNRYLLGWAVDLNDYNNHLKINIYIDGIKAASCKADILRSDLVQNGIGNGKHSFKIEVPESFCDGNEHDVEIRSAGDECITQGCHSKKILLAKYITIPKLADHILITKRTRTTDIIVCVHNALDDVRTCLQSILDKTFQPYRLILINDGSDQETSDYLTQIAVDRPGTVLIHNQAAQGYTKAANQGLKSASADYNILLNSDTIVTHQWLERIIECGESNPSIGIIGPLSNAASYQSVPRLRDDSDDWSVNSLPEGVTVDHMAEAIFNVSQKSFPRIPFINGFCYVIKSQVLKKVGFFDEVTFPMGYGEENDYSIRARNSGFSLAVADHAYVYHHKSKSFSHERRRKLSTAGRKKLERKYGQKVILEGIRQLERINVLDKIRFEITKITDNKNTLQQFEPEAKPKVLWLLLGSGGGGGALSIVQEANCLRELGCVSCVAVQERFKAKLLSNYAHLSSDVFLFYKKEKDLQLTASKFDIVVATYFKTMIILGELCNLNNHIIPAYYIQDYEPWIVSYKNKDYCETVKEAYISYTRIKNLFCFAKTEWIIQTVQKFHPVIVHKVAPGLDTNVFPPDASVIRKTGYDKLRIVAMVRPNSPRRAPRNTMVLLQNIKKRYPEKVDIAIFGCQKDDPKFLALPHDFKFNHKGILTAPQVSKLFSDSDIFVDMSIYQAFGRTGLEAMARGCAVILPINGGTHEYAEHGVNCLLVDALDNLETEEALANLVTSPPLRLALAENGLTTASRFNVLSAALSEAIVFQNAFSKSGLQTSGMNSQKAHRRDAANSERDKIATGTYKGLENKRFGNKSTKQGRTILEAFHSSMLPNLVKENPTEIDNYWPWKTKRKHWNPKVMLGTLFSGENELGACKMSIEKQDYQYIHHEIIEGLPKKEAMSTLYETFMQSNHDLLIKIDADMVILDPEFTSQVVDIFRHSDDLILLQMAISDYYSGCPIQGVNAYSKKLAWRRSAQHDLFTDKTEVPKHNRLVVWTKFVDSVIHAPQSSAFHSFHFGVHRGLKAVKALEESNATQRAEEQMQYLESSWRHYLIRKERNLLMASLGAEMAFRNTYQVHHLDYTDPTMRKHSDDFDMQPQDELEAHVLSLRAEKLGNTLLQGIRDKSFQENVHSKLKTILFLIPHTKIFGGINRFFELSAAIRKLGLSCTIAVPDQEMAPYKLGENIKRQDYPDIEVISFSKAMAIVWDVVVCGDYSHGIMLLLPLFRCGLSAVYLLNGWQQRNYNIEQIRLVDPDIVIANSSYVATHYQELAPHVVPGGINLDVFRPAQGPLKNKDRVIIFVFGASNKPRKRFEDAIEACNILHNKGYSIEVHALTTSFVDCTASFPFKQYTKLNSYEVADLICNSDVVLCPEEDAGWNNPAAEALGCQRPLVCTSAGTTDFAFNGKTATVVEPRNPQAQADAVEEFLQNPLKAKKMAKAGYEKICEFSWLSVGRSLVSVLEKGRIAPALREQKNAKALKKISKRFADNNGGSGD